MPRVALPAVGPAYLNRQLKLSAQVCKNLRPEINPESRNIVSNVNTPGLKTFAVLESNGIDRGLHAFNGKAYGVSGTKLHSIAADGTNIQLGTISGTGHCSFADDGTQLVIVSSDGFAYIYTVADGVQQITDSDLVNPTWVTYLNTQFIFDNNRGVDGEFVTSQVAADFNVDALDFARAESHPDDIVRGIVFNQNVYFMGSKSIEPWYNSGVGSPPFDRVQGGIRRFGLAGTHAVATTPNYLYFLDDQRIPRRSGGLDYVNIGTPALGVEFAKYSKISDCIVFHYVIDHQDFVAYTFPTADRTWVYHEPSNSWFQLSYGVDNARSRANSFLYIYGLNLVADHSNGNIYQWDLCTHTDNGAAIQRQRDTAVIHGGLFGVPGKQLFFERVEFILAIGKCLTSGLGAGPDAASGALAGVCATTDDLTQGELVSAHGLQICTQLSNGLSWTSVDTDVYTLADSKAVSCTFAFCRETLPTSTAAGLIDIYDTSRSASGFSVMMGTDGFIYVKGQTNAGTEILNCKITNNGASFADSTAHLITFIANMDDVLKREIYINGTNRTENTSYVTWTTYTDALIQFTQTGGADTLQYGFGLNLNAATSWGSTNQGANYNELNSIGYLTLSNTCTLVGPGVFDTDGWVLDPQGDFSGWYSAQPEIAFGPSLWKQAGSFSTMQIGYENDLGNTFYDNATVQDQQDGTKLNYLVGGETGGDPGTGGLPPPPPAVQVALPSNHWDYLSNDMDYNYIDLSGYSQDTFLNVAGRTIESISANLFSVSAPIAISVSTADAGKRFRVLRVQNGSVVLTNAAGTILDWQYRKQGGFIEGGTAVEIPADGATYYMVVTSDSTGTTRIEGWDYIP